MQRAKILWLSIASVTAAVSGCGRIGFDADVTDSGAVLDADDTADVRGADRSVDAPITDALDAFDAPDAFDATVPDDAVFVSPLGDDDNAGTQASPLLTFSAGLSRMEPGGTLVALPGDYGMAAGTGSLTIDCRTDSTTCSGSPCASGSSAAPIVVRSLLERRARVLPGATTSPAAVRGCSNYLIEGFVFEHEDNAERSWPLMNLSESTNITVRRNILRKSNREVNGHLLEIGSSDLILVEENEFYDYHRVAITSFVSSNVTVRRNYLNARNYPDLVGGYESLFPGMGDSALVCTHSSLCLFENNISEGAVGRGISHSANKALEGELPGAGDNGRYIGNIIMDAEFGLFANSGCDGADPCTSEELIVSRLLIRDSIFIGSVFGGIYVRGAQIVIVDRTTSFGGRIRLDENSGNVGLSSSGTISSSLVISPEQSGIQVYDQDTWSVQFSNSFGFDPAYDSDGDYSVSGRENLEVDPALGGCIHRIPDSSPMFGTGNMGGNRGADVVFRTENAVLTPDLLWHPETGAFPCGAIVVGVNDTGSVCSTVHTRLGVGSACPVQ